MEYWSGNGARIRRCTVRKWLGCGAHLGPSPPSKGVIEHPPIPKPKILKGARDERPKVEDGRGGKEGDDQRCKVDFEPILVQKEARVGLGGGEVPARRPLRLVVVEHELRRDVADAVDGDHEVLRVAEGVSPVPPVCKPERDEDHGRVRAKAHKVEPPNPLGRREAPAAAAKELALAHLARDARGRDAVRVLAAWRCRGRGPRIRVANVRLDKPAAARRTGQAEAGAAAVQRNGRGCQELLAIAIAGVVVVVAGADAARGVGLALRVRLPPVGVEGPEIVETAGHCVGDGVRVLLSQ